MGISVKDKNVGKAQYSIVNEDDFYACHALIEYQQCIDEGLDIESYKDFFEAVAKLPKNEVKKQLGDIIFKIVTSASIRKDYPYNEPSDLEGIRALRKKHVDMDKMYSEVSENKLHGAWLGRVCGCLHGKNFEGLRTEEFVPFLEEINNYPIHRYIYKTDIENSMYAPLFSKRYRAHFADTVDGMPVDDDTNYTVLAQSVIERYGKEFTPEDVAFTWQISQSKYSYCSAERISFRNVLNGYIPPASAAFQNPFREWIGAQIRSDYYGYINPGNPKLAADMAWRDASISHTKNGIYGSMFVAAMLAAAAVTDRVETVILTGLSEIPYTSRLYEGVMTIVKGFENGMTQKEIFEYIHQKYNEYNPYDWTHTIPNAMIVTASLLWGQCDYGKSICMCVEAGFDTDCNAATVGSIVGMMIGIEKIPEYWTAPVKDTLCTSIFNIGTVTISDRVRLTIRHAGKEGIIK